MEEPLHTMMSRLFAQLDQSADETSIETSIVRFIETYRPLAGGVQLHEAAFWFPSQANFLREAILDDADWADVAEELNAELQATGLAGNNQPLVAASAG